MQLSNELRRFATRISGGNKFAIVKLFGRFALAANKSFLAVGRRCISEHEVMSTNIRGVSRGDTFNEISRTCSGLLGFISGACIREP